MRVGLLPDKCAICDLGPEWNGLSLTLQLDHINGKPKDNRIENLRLLCPNCHSQTETFAGRRNRQNAPVIAIQKQADSLEAQSITASHVRARKIVWPSDDELVAWLQREAVLRIGKQLGVSDVAVRKHCKRRGIKVPARGYWAKRHAHELSGDAELQRALA